MTPSPEPTALALIDAYLRLLRYCPDPRAWSAEAFATDRLGDGYYRRVLALAQAVEVPLTLFTEPDLAGRFFGTRPDGCYAALRPAIDAYLNPAARDRPRGDEQAIIRREPGDLLQYEREARAFFLQDLGTIFSQYLAFLMQLQRLQGFNGDWLMASSAGARFSIATTAAIITSLDQPAIDRLRQLLARIIDPAGRCYPRTELVARFNYPSQPRTQPGARAEADSL